VASSAMVSNEASIMDQTDSSSSHQRRVAMEDIVDMAELLRPLIEREGGTHKCPVSSQVHSPLVGGPISDSNHRAMTIGSSRSSSTLGMHRSRTVTSRKNTAISRGLEATKTVNLWLDISKFSISNISSNSTRSSNFGKTKAPMDSPISRPPDSHNTILLSALRWTTRTMVSRALALMNNLCRRLLRGAFKDLMEECRAASMNSQVFTT